MSSEVRGFRSYILNSILSLGTNQDKSKAAAKFKAKGNAAYQQRQFTTAADLYTKAIELSPKQEPVYFSNRAACQ